MLGSNLTHTSIHNYRTVLETVRNEGSVSRADIARKTTLSAQTVSNITKKLLNAGLILEADRVQEGRGAPSMSLEINPDGAYSIGLDMDQNHLTGILMDLKGTVRKHVTQSVRFPEPEEAMNLMESTIDLLLGESGIPATDIWGIGIGFPGPLEISEGSIVTNAVNPQAFPGWEHVRLLDEMHQRTGIPVFLENNATAAAIGERWFGRGRTIGTFFYLFLGQGLGGGIVINKIPYPGRYGNAGEIGYVPPYSPIRMPSPFRKPHVGIHFNMALLLKRITDSGTRIESLGELNHLFLKRNPIVMEWVIRGSELLAPLVLSIEYILDPEAIFFGGSLPGIMIEDMRSRVEKLLPERKVLDDKHGPALLAAEAGNHAAALGVATIPLHEALSPRQSLLANRDSLRINPGRKFNSRSGLQF